MTDTKATVASKYARVALDPGLRYADGFLDFVQRANHVGAYVEAVQDSLTLWVPESQRSVVAGYLRDWMEEL